MKSESLFSMPHSDFNDVVEKLHKAGLRDGLIDVIRFNRRGIHNIIQFIGMFHQYEFNDEGFDKYQNLNHYWRALEDQGLLPSNSFKPDFDRRYIGYEVLSGIYFNQTYGMPWSKEALAKMSEEKHVFFEMLITPEAIISLMRNWVKICKHFNCPVQELMGEDGLLEGVNIQDFKKFLQPRVGVGGWRAISTVPRKDVTGNNLESKHDIFRVFEKESVYGWASGAEIIIRDLFGYLTSRGEWPSPLWSLDYEEGVWRSGCRSLDNYWFFRGAINGFYQIMKVGDLEQGPSRDEWCVAMSRIPGR
jgi:hypothetical protein